MSTRVETNPPPAPDGYGSRHLHRMPNRRNVSRMDRLRQKLWTLRARVWLAIRRG